MGFAGNAPRWLLFLWALALAASCSGTADEAHDGSVDQIEQAVDDPLPHDGASRTQIELDWLTAFEVPTSLSQMTLRVRNHGTSPASVTLALVSFGLDFRTARRALSPMTVPAGQAVTRVIDVRRDQPIKSITYSSDAFVEARLDRVGQAPLVIDSPHVYNHYSADYSTMTGYRYDDMIESFSGGQLANDAFDLRGQVLTGAVYTEIGVLRKQEAKALGVQVTPAAGPRTGVSSGWGPDQPPQATGTHTVCVDWKTRFVDQAQYEDYVPGDGEQALDASYAKAAVVKVLQSPCPMPMGGSACTQTIWTGYLSSTGCVSLDLTPNIKHALYLDTKMKKGNAIFDVKRFTAAGTDMGVQSYRLDFYPANPGSPLPPPMLKTGFHSSTNVSAVAARALRASDMAIADATYTLNAGKDCPQYGTNVSCGGGTVLNIAPAIVPGMPGVKGDIYWKYVIGHEIGHLLQHQGMGTFTHVYTFAGGQPDPPEAPAHCTCAHVDTTLTTNVHCLQSWEISSDAQQEGLGHFFASKMWNNQLDNNCAFVYYKEFLNHSGVTEGPPIEKSCKNAVKWRNVHCDDRSGGTEYDWLQFYWDINTTGSKVTVQDLFATYRELCGGALCDGQQPTWDQFRDGALAHFGSTSDARFLHIVSSGEAFGVDDD